VAATNVGGERAGRRSERGVRHEHADIKHHDDGLDEEAERHSCGDANLRKPTTARRHLVAVNPGASGAGDSATLGRAAA